MPDIKIEKIPSSPEKSLESSEQVISPEKKPEQEVAERETETEQAAQDFVLPSDEGDQNTAIGGSTIVLHRVENILSQGMDKIFLEMDANTQRVFKVKGEETAKQITSLLSKAKVRTKEIINLIVSWLRIIPKVNKYYIEQEAKIKAELIIKMHERK